ncbi:MAG TPA: hypothetical protein VNT75_22845 [Symbiobacteriaceae bacterium]|nr:hypothetical protein [Symbiobacteriaceae bacterium]
MQVRYVMMLVAALLISGCAAAPALRPVEARSRLLANPGVAQWYAAHSAPAIFAELSPWQAKRWRRYQPAVMFDRVKEGYLVRLEAQFGPAPRQLELLMDPATGTLLSPDGLPK